MNAEAINRGLELRPLAELRLTAPPVVAGPPIGNELLKLPERRPVLPAFSSLRLRPPRLLKESPQVGQCVIRRAIAEGSYRTTVGSCARMSGGEDERACASCKQLTPCRHRVGGHANPPFWSSERNE